MGMYDELLSESDTIRKLPCTMVAVFKSCTQPDKTDLEKALADRGIYGSVIARKIKDTYGIRITGNTVQRHRNGGCSCG